MSDGGMDTGSDERRYDPGPSFIENDRPAVRLAELPAWLQTFASSVGDPAEDEPETHSAPATSEEPAGSRAQPQPGEAASLPDWLQDGESQHHAPPEPQDSAPSFMITEDDLPDWLRSIPGEATAAPTPPPAPSQDDAGSMSMNGVLEVPPISRAWVTATAERELSDGGSVFALVASQIEPVAAGYTSARGIEGSSRQATTGSRNDYSKLRGDEAAGEADEREERAEAGGANRLRIVLLVLLILIIVALLLFGQLQ